MGIGSMSPPFITSALDRGEWSASCPGRFTSREIAPGIHYVEGYVDARTCLDVMERRKISPFSGNRTSIVKSIAYRYTD
jgi:hypothetical protein